MQVEVRDNIISVAEELFLRYGYKRVTMDDIAKEMAISKKTIYQFFKDKKEIVCSATEQHLQKESAAIEKLEEESENVIVYLVNLGKQLRRHISAINPAAMYDLQKYYPDGWKIFINYKKDVFLKSVVRIIRRGMEEGYFRPDIDPEVLGIMRMEQVQMSFDENIFPRNRFDFTEVQMQMVMHFVMGILTEKGRILFENYSKSTDTNEIIN